MRRFALCAIGAAILAVGLFRPSAVNAAPALQLPWPAGSQHQITVGYTYSRPGSSCGDHTGIDYYAIDFDFSYSDPVAAAVAGTVHLFYNDPGYGYYATVDHGGGFVSLYAHFRSTNSFAVPDGSYVSQGQLLGYADSTGHSTGNHLHFRMTLNGAAYEPEPMSGVRGFGQWGSCYTSTYSPFWISRHPTDVQKVTDSTGDGKADAGVFYQGTGQWYVAPSTGSNFGAPSHWITGHGIGSSRQFAADVNHDGKTDAVVWFASDGSWWVSLSTGSSYQPFTRWSFGHGIGSTNQFLADVNGDGRADAVVFFRSTGTWYVVLSTGSGFGASTQWTTGHGISSDDQLLADVTGDSRADAIVFFDSTGSWYVTPSTGSGFGASSLWAAGHGIGSDRRFIADVNGDLKGDAVVFFAPAGSWYVTPSTGSAFGAASLWITGHGIGSDNQLLADVTGDATHKADAIVYFGQSSGAWYVAPSNGSSFGASSLWITGYGIGS